MMATQKDLIIQQQTELDQCRATISNQRSEIADLKQKNNSLLSAKRELKDTLYQYQACLCVAEGYIQRINQVDTAAFKQGIPTFHGPLTPAELEQYNQFVCSPFESPRNPTRTQLHVMDDIFGEKPHSWMDL